MRLEVESASINSVNYCIMINLGSIVCQVLGLKVDEYCYKAIYILYSLFFKL